MLFVNLIVHLISQYLISKNLIEIEIPLLFIFDILIYDKYLIKYIKKKRGKIKYKMKKYKNKKKNK